MASITENNVDNVCTSSDDKDAGKKTTRAGPVERLHNVVKLLREIESVTDQADNKRSRKPSLGKAISITENVIKLLSTAKITYSKRTRTPNEYNQFVSAHMQTLKESTMTSTEKFKHCIQLWNEHKAQLAANPVQTEA